MTTRSRVLILTCATAVLFLGANTLTAQYRENVYGGYDCRETGYRGVQPLNSTTCLGSGATTQAIAAGVSFSSSADCSTGDAYVVRFDYMNGGLVWENTYDVNNARRNDSATSIAQVEDGFIVVGVTDMGQGNSDVFLMKILCDGSLAWTRTYGGPGVDYASDIKVTTSGAGAVAPGDFIVSGYTTTQQTGMIRGWIFRTNGFGVLRWSKYYEIPQPHYGERFWLNALIEARPTYFQTTGDAVAVGGTDMTLAGGVVGAVALRVSGVDGTFSNPVIHGCATYDSPGQVEEFNDLAEANWPQANGLYPLYLAGMATQTVAGTTTSDILLVRSLPNPTAPALNQSLIGDWVLGVNTEVALGIDGLHTSITDNNDYGVALTGYHIGGFNDRDGILITVDSVLSTLYVTLRFGRMGPGSDDVGRSIQTITGGPPWWTNVGFLIAGGSTSKLKGLCPRDPEDFYAIFSDDQGITGEPASCSYEFFPTVLACLYDQSALRPEVENGPSAANAYAWCFWPNWGETLVCPRPTQFCKPVAPGARSLPMNMELAQRY